MARYIFLVIIKKTIDNVRKLVYYLTSTAAHERK